MRRSLEAELETVMARDDFDWRAGGCNFIAVPHRPTTATPVIAGTVAAFVLLVVLSQVLT